MIVTCPTFLTGKFCRDVSMVSGAARNVLHADPKPSAAQRRISVTGLITLALFGCASAKAASPETQTRPYLSTTPQAAPPATSLKIPIEPTETYPASGTSDGYLFNLRPLGSDLGGLLADHGVYLVGKSVSEEMGAVAGGIKRGGFYEGYAVAGIDLDLQRISDVRGGSLHFLLSDLQGQAFYNYTGSTYANNRVYASTPAFRLNELSYEQELFGGGADIQLGRIPAYTQFDGSELYCTFLTDLCRTPAAYTFDRGSPSYLVSSWAAIGEIRLTNSIYTHAGIYENEPILAQSNHGGFPGPDWGLNYANGATVPAEIGYRTTIENDQHPRTYSVGGFYNTGRYADPLLNSAGRNRILSGGAAKMDTGSSLVFVQGQQMVYRPDSSDRGLTLFSGADWAASGQPVIERMIFGGAYWKGLIKSRPRDTIGIAVSYTAVNSRITERVSSLLSRTGGGQASRGEISYQAYYGVAVAPGFLIKPFVEFISHPDQASSARPSGNNTHAVIAGTLLEIDAAALLGLSTLVHKAFSP